MHTCSLRDERHPYEPPHFPDSLQMSFKVRRLPFTRFPISAQSFRVYLHSANVTCRLFSDPAVHALQFLDVINMKDPTQKAHFYRNTLKDALPNIPKVSNEPCLYRLELFASKRTRMCTNMQIWCLSQVVNVYGIHLYRIHIYLYYYKIYWYHSNH